MESIRSWTKNNTPSRILAVLDFGRKTQAELAHGLGVSAATVNRWVTGKHLPDFRSRRALMTMEETFKTRSRMADDE